MIIRPSDYEAKLEKCPVCGYSDYREISASEDVTLRFSECRQCHSRFMNPQLNDEVYARLYSGEYWQNRVGNLRLRLEKQFRRAAVLAALLQNRIPRNPETRLLEIGAGYGGVAYGLGRALGLKVVAVEPDQTAREFAKSELGLEALTFDDLRNRHAGGGFEVLCLVHVLEHQTNPGKFLAECLKFLRQDGILVIEVPNGEVINHYSMVHPIIFRKRGLEMLLSSLGFQGKFYFHSGPQLTIGPKKYMVYLGFYEGNYRGFSIPSLSSRQLKKLPEPLGRMISLLNSALLNRFPTKSKRLLGKLRSIYGSSEN